VVREPPGLDLGQPETYGVGTTSCQGAGLVHRATRARAERRGRRRRWRTNDCANPANAATNPYSARSVCGSSYTVTVASHDLAGKARLYLLYAPRSGYNCAVTIKTSKVGTPTSTEAWLLVRGSSWVHDKGPFKYYAGPVRRYARHTCVAYAGGDDGTNWTSGWVGCG